MKKFLALLLTLAMVSSLLCGMTVFAAEEDAIVVADEGWTNAKYDSETQILTNVGEGYSFKWTGGSSIEYNGTTPLTAEKVVIPSSVNGVAITTVSKDPFGGGNTVKEVIFSEGITTFSKPGFSGYGNLEKAVLPSTMTSLGQEVFRNCSKLNSVNIPSKIAKIDNLTFAGCSSLKSLTIPDTVTSLGQGVFSSVGFEKVTLPSGITEIPKEGFKQSTVQEIVFKGEITYLGQDAFRLATQLKSMVFEGNTKTAPTLATASNGCPINSDGKNPMAVTVYYPASATTAFEASEYLAQWTGNNTTISFARIQEEQGGCSISDVTSDGVNTTVTYTAVDTDNNATVLVVIALYNGDEMIGAKVVSKDEQTATITGVAGATSAKIFMWSDFTSATPLYESSEFGPIAY